MYIRTKLFVLFSVFLWSFGFFSGLIYRESTTSVCDPLLSRKLRAQEEQLPNKEQKDIFSHADKPKITDQLPPSTLPNTIATFPTTPQDMHLNEDRCLVFQNRSLSVDKFSIIIPTYKRVKLLKKVLTNYCSLGSHIDVIIVVWNNIKEPVHKDIKDFSCDVKLIIKTLKVNSLNNRFIHFSEIRTQAVLSADDDLLILHEDLIYQFETWKQFKHLIIGFAPRKHIPQSEGSSVYVYGGPPKDDNKDRRYSFILTTSAMFHVQYLDLYQSRLPKHLREFVDKNMNCEDIFLNAIVADHLNKTMGSRQSPALLVPYKEIKMIEGENKGGGYRGLWSRPKHKKVRNNCLSLISKEFHGFPFEYSTFKITTA